jgi:hypothetical protein
MKQVAIFFNESEGERFNQVALEDLGPSTAPEDDLTQPID